ncbi:hypothetical protein HGRIS_006414 [Hohenbuehelia grisea]|uniref:guanosine-diphosphatase n=1 Tax=Hohenbuehelia grisea TaxID=104357 RepID=A0ABR3K1L5_9AGAR
MFNNVASRLHRERQPPDDPPQRQQRQPETSLTLHPPSALSSGAEPQLSPSTPTYTSLSRRKKMAILSPRSANYERLEGGMGPQRNGVLGRFAWKKFAIAATVLVALVYFFGPREPRNLIKWTGSSGDHKPVVAVPTLDDDDGPQDIPAPPVTEPPAHDSGKTESHKPATVEFPPEPSTGHHPTTFESDPDPAQTTHCKAPHKAGGPIVQWGLMIDAGSTGSRIHVYKFNNCGASAAYEYEIFKQIQPGLSAYAGRPEEAARSLDALMDEAMRTVPASLRKCTPVAVKATAGLRLLGASESQTILKAVRDRLQDAYPFPLADHTGDHETEASGAVAIMDGRDEGVYAWITANYLLDTIRGDSPHGAPTYAVLDLGGASTQIVFEPTFGDSAKGGLAEGEHKYDLQFGGKKHVLYQHSYLGYGLMRARQHVHQLVDFMASIRPAKGGKTAVPNPCLAKGTTRQVDVEDRVSGEKHAVTMVGEDVGSFDACNRIVQLVLAKDSICELKPCSFDGVYQPSLLDTFPSGKVLLLSYFYDRLQPFLASMDASSTATSSTTSASKSLPPQLTISTLATLAQQVCAGEASWQEHWHSDAALLTELKDRPEWCLDLTFMHGLLRLGYEFGEHREVQVGKRIEGTELGWALGAAIAMVGGDLKCRV